MNKNSVLLICIGLFAGLFIGFYAANKINRNAVLQQTSAQTTANAPFLNQQAQSAADVKPSNQRAMMPEIAETLDKAENEPQNFDAQIKAGDMYAKIQRFDKAIEYYEKANKIKPEDYDSIVKIGNSYFDAQEYEKAEKWYSQALEKNPKDINVRTDLGITFVERQNPDLDRAIKEFQTSLQENPRHEPSLYNLAIANFKKGDTEETKKILAEMRQINPQSKLTEKLNQIISAQ